MTTSTLPKHPDMPYSVNAEGSVMVMADIHIPHSPEAGQVVLGGLMLDNDCWDEVVLLLTPDDFFVGWHRAIYRAMADLAGESLPLDLITLSDRMEADIFTFSHAQKFARQQFAICIHTISFLWSVNINVLPAPSDLGWGTLRSEIVLPVSGIITLATVCLATFFIQFLCVYSAISAAFQAEEKCCQWQHSRPDGQQHSRCGAEKCNTCDMGDDSREAGGGE